MLLYIAILYIIYYYIYYYIYIIYILYYYISVYYNIFIPNSPPQGLQISQPQQMLCTWRFSHLQPSKKTLPPSSHCHPPHHHSTYKHQRFEREKKNIHKHQPSYHHVALPCHRCKYISEINNPALFQKKRTNSTSLPLLYIIDI